MPGLLNTKLSSKLLIVFFNQVSYSAQTVFPSPLVSLKCAHSISSTPTVLHDYVSLNLQQEPLKNVCSFSL